MIIAVAVIGIIPACKKSAITDPCAAQNASRTSTGDLNSGAMAKTTGRPFKGSVLYTLDTTISLPCNCGSMSTLGSFKGVGTLTHFGLMTSKNKTCVAPILVNGNFIGYHITITCGTFTTANGDEIAVDIPTYDVFFNSTSATGTMTGNFTGGTGRFVNATGSFTGTITIPISNPAIATLTNIDGSIDY
jgi:hypothetical protein